jgi:KDO2-lipid IV(A) lauroyltransferase
VELLAVRALLAPVRLLPKAAALRTARCYTAALDRLVPRLRATALRNLELAMAELGMPERRRLVDRVFVSLARLLWTLARFPSIGKPNVGEWIRYEGFEHFEEARRRGKGVLFATGHLGNWELSSFAHALMARPMSIVVRPLDNPLLDEWLTQRRASSGNVVLGREQFVRPLLRALRNNEAVGILADQNVTAAEGVFVDFFGRKACVDPGFARLAAKSGAAVIPGFAVWSESEARYVLKFYPLLEMTGDARADTQAVQSALERAIREYPDQWLWIHRRWKTRPEGEAPLY